MAIETMHLANLAFFLNYDSGTTKDEVESEILRVMLQTKEETQYDRNMGGSFNLLEMDDTADSTVAYFLFVANMVESIYNLNEEHNFNPYIIVGAESFGIEKNPTGLEIYIEWRLLQDIAIQGNLTYGG